MFPRPFDGAPDRWFWLHGRAESETQAARLFTASQAWGRGLPERVGIFGAFAALARAIRERGGEPLVRDPALQHVAALQLSAVARDEPMPNVSTGELPDDLDALVAPAGMLGFLESDEAVHAHLASAARALRPGGVYLAEVWHPRLVDPDAGPLRPLPLRALGSLPGGRARLALTYGRDPPPVMKLTVNAERNNGLPLASSDGLVRLLTLAEWRASVAAVPHLEEAALMGPLSSFRDHHPDVGDLCTLVLVRAGR